MIAKLRLGEAGNSSTTCNSYPRSRLGTRRTTRSRSRSTPSRRKSRCPLSARASSAGLATTMTRSLSTTCLLGRGQSHDRKQVVIPVRLFHTMTGSGSPSASHFATASPPSSTRTSAGLTVHAGAAVSRLGQTLIRPMHRLTLDGEAGGEAVAAERVVGDTRVVPRLRRAHTFEDDGGHVVLCHNSGCVW